MWKALLVVVFLAGCVQLPPSPEDIQAKKFENVPGKVVIYIARDRIDSMLQDTIWLGDTAQITTQPGTYYRWVTDPGVHRIEGTGPSTAAVTIRTEAGRIYYVQHLVIGSIRSGVKNSHLRQVNEQTGRMLVTNGQSLL
ncbi:MAG: hypothetical protein KIT18_14695 [Burkholderiales bacterium]|nr:hypothetical protein [Burkholderiales bacterium]